MKHYEKLLDKSECTIDGEIKMRKKYKMRFDICLLLVVTACVLIACTSTQSRTAGTTVVNEAETTDINEAKTAVADETTATVADGIEGNDVLAAVSVSENEKSSESMKSSENENFSTIEEQTAVPSQLSLVMVGDVLLHTPVLESGRLPDDTYCYDHLFQYVKPQVEAADIAIVNQEVILGGTELGLSGYPCFNGPYEVADALAGCGFDVVLHATNHALDKGEKGVRNCLDYWENEYPQIQVAGINKSKEAQENEVVIVEKNGIKVAILNYTYGTNGISLPSSAPYLVNLLDKEKIEKDVTFAKEMADFVVVCPHWGTEYQHAPDKNQQKWAAYFADLGVDLVIGTHPHVIQPVEWVEGENGNQALVYYSLGNFVNATSGQGSGVADRMLGAMAEVRLVKNEEGMVIIDSFEALPLVTHLESGEQKITVYPLEDYTAELENGNEIIMQDSSFSIDYLKQIWNEVEGNHAKP